jgi:signal transduction histidine kinase
MRSIAVKLALAFVLVGLIGAVLMAFLVQQSTQRDFSRLVLDQNQQVLVTSLTEYYRTNGSWAGVEDVFRLPSGKPFPDPAAGKHEEARRALFTLADENGLVLFSGRPDQMGEVVPSADLGRGERLQVDGKTVGWLLFFPPSLDRLGPGSPEGDFLVNFNRAVLLSALGAALVALVLGGVLAYTLTRSLRELTAATQALAGGELGHQVKVRSRDELGALAASFNQMSAELARSNDLRRQMTADIAHDLRTPLSVIAGYAEALSDGKLNGTPEVYDILYQETRQLNRLVEDLRTLSLADAGELQLIRQPASLPAILERVAARHAVTAQQKGISITVQAGPDVPEVSVDVERIAQVFDNLMMNAIRFTPSGGEITLAAQSVDGVVRLQVRDNGRGIAPEDLPSVFERFYRGDRARPQDGESGLGLAIARSIVEAHSGTIGVESEPGRGTTFTITLPPFIPPSLPGTGGN